LDASSSRSPWRSWCPSIAAPAPLVVQLLQVESPLAVIARPSGMEPVSMSCVFGFSVRPLTISPFSFSAVSLVRLLVPWS